MISQIGSENAKAQDKYWWGLIFLLVAGMVGGNYYLSQYSLLSRVVGSCVLLGASIGIALKTSLGRTLWTQWLEAIQEVRKMYWPTRQETLHTTLAVLAMVVVMGILLWTADFFLLRAVKWLMTGHWGA
jgi:preprotein translocase subunit SecE